MDVIHKATKSLDYNRYQWLAVALIVVLVFWTFGCQASTRSIVSGERVSRAEFTAEVAGETARLEAEVIAFQAKADAGHADLAEQEAKRVALLGILQTAVAPVLPEPVANILLALLGVSGITYGAAKKADLVRKNGEIKKLKDS